MYNEELKREYIKNNLDKNYSLSTNGEYIFNTVEKYEERYGKDASTFTIKEIQGMYCGMFTPSVDTLINMNSKLRLYTQYCLSRNMVPDHQNHYDEADVDFLYACCNNDYKVNAILTKEQLLKVSQQLKNVSDQFIILALFEGICGSQMLDLAYITTDDISGNKIRLHSGKEVEVSDELIKLAYKSAETEEYIEYPKTGMERSPVMRYDDYPNVVLKKIVNCTSNNDMARRKRLYSKLVRMQDYINELADADKFEFYVDLSTKNLLESGRINAINNAKKQYNISTIDAVKLPEITERYGTVNVIGRYIKTYSSALGEE